MTIDLWMVREEIPDRECVYIGDLKSWDEAERFLWDQDPDELLLDGYEAVCVNRETREARWYTDKWEDVWEGFDVSVLFRD